MASLSRAFLKGFVRAHVALFRLSRGRIGGRIRGLPVALLTVPGRRSGVRRTVPLCAFEEGQGVVVVASNGGATRHPAWFHNVMAAGRATVEMAGRPPRELTARLVEGDERARLWARVVVEAPFYAAYQEKTERAIPLVLLAP